jgi:type I restriction enzyme, S subunit
MNTYPDYKPGLEFIERIPINWGVQRAKYVFSEVKDISTDGSETLLSVSEYYGVKPRHLVVGDGEFISRAETLEGYKVCQRGDLVMNIMLAWKRGLGVTNYKGIVSPSYAIFRPNLKVHSKYYHYLLRTDTYVNLFRRHSTGIIDSRLRLYPDVFLGLPLLLPPINTQHTIANFLDDKTTKIDNLITKKQRQIELLQEYCAALINQIVSGGQEKKNIFIDNVPTPWLYTLPKSWTRKKIKLIASLKGRLGWQNLRAEEYVDEGPLLVSSTHFYNGEIDWSRCNHVTQERFELAPEIILKEQDVLFMKDGALMGKLAYVNHLPAPACLNSHLLLLRPQKGAFLPRFLYYVLMSDYFEAYMIQHRTGTTFFGFSQQSMGDFPLSFPSIEEQIKICTYLDKLINNVQGAIDKIYQTISHLNEYRTALVSAAATGKIDVRGFKN